MRKNGVLHYTEIIKMSTADCVTSVIHKYYGF